MTEIDNMYNKFCAVICEDMDTYLKYTFAQKKTRKYFKIHKSFWDDNLTILWKDMNATENAFIKCKSSRRKKSYIKDRPF